MQIHSLWLALAALPLAAAAGDIPGPKLEPTMAFIHDQLDQQGVLRFVDNVHDESSGRNWLSRHAMQVSDISADPVSCTVSYRWELFQGGELLDEKDSASIRLREVRKVRVTRRNKEYQDGLSPAAYSTQLTPPIYLVELRTAEGIDTFGFNDPRTALHVANAFIHGVELCGGSKALY